MDLPPVESVAATSYEGDGREHARPLGDRRRDPGGGGRHRARPCVETLSARPVACLQALAGPVASRRQIRSPACSRPTVSGAPAQLAAGLLAPRSIDPAPERWTGTCRA